MKILLTGANGYVGKRLLPVLLKAGHTVVCLVRDQERFNPSSSNHDSLLIIEGDLLKKNTLQNIPQDIQAAYYLVHSMRSGTNYTSKEHQSAINFNLILEKTQIEHVVYLSGIVNQQILSTHLSSRYAVETTLAKGKYHLTTLRAGIIIGSGSASFEIIRDLVEKLPFMIAPRWLNTHCQPIGISDVISFLAKSLMNERLYDKNFDIGGPDIITYKEMLLGYANARKLRRKIITVPVMSPRLSSYWLFFITSTSFNLASALVDSMKIEVICRDSEINTLLSIVPSSYPVSLKKALMAIDQTAIPSSWKDAMINGPYNLKLSEYPKVPTHGCYIDLRQKQTADVDASLEKIWQIGGYNGWYYAQWLWRLRGIIDKMHKGVGLKRGRTHPTIINAGDVIDFWRVLYANKQKRKLLLYAEMKLPGEAWLEFTINNNTVTQTATFRPHGLLGRIYWFCVYPVHGILFRGLLKKITS